MLFSWINKYLREGKFEAEYDVMYQLGEIEGRRVVDRFLAEVDGHVGFYYLRCRLLLSQMLCRKLLPAPDI